MKFKRYIILTMSVVCAVGVGTYTLGRINDEINIRKSVRENIRAVRPDDVVVYSNGEVSATMSKEDYDLLSDEEKKTRENTYKVLFEKIQLNK